MSTTTVASRPRLRVAVAAGAAALAAAMGVGRFVFTPIIPVMGDGAGLSTTDAGLLASVNYVGYLVGCLLAVAPVVRRHRGGFLTAGLVLTVLTLAAMPLSASFALWSAARGVSGVASAFAFVTAADLVLTLLRRHARDDLSGWVFGGVGAGIALSGLVTPAAAAIGGWTATWWVAAGLALVLTIPALRLARVPEAPDDDGGPDGPPPRTQLLVALGVAYFLEGAGYIITGTFLVDVATDIGPGWVAASSWTVAGLAAVPSCVLWARVAARRGRGPALLAALGVQAVGLALPAFVVSPVAVVVSAVVFGGTFVAIVMLTLPLARTLAGRSAGPVVAVFSALYGLGQVVGPFAVLLVGGDDARPALALGGALVVAATLVAVPAALLRSRAGSPG
ncbi:YbfB/YjiJ family MFS transporter [Actinomycetospora termitidis]|uniref:YbfB/YjiJ family MFS transporter n=1 Tax=Actinomycetospora termitidis TaxID=3053470 RepID=A0ABT7MCH1_9PSEU|nr:YbfB/YjiJ family MFS transporter [Actinomycetospora sp. Odt1-22]MDL5158370.1 YbfB/YjiJ family MFS transporter [Actinomycetospora sp. Odt1-22]